MPFERIGDDELLHNDSFIRWVLYISDDDAAKWEDYLLQYPGEQSTVAEARKQLVQLAGASAELRMQQSLVRLNRGIDGRRRFVIPVWVRYIAAAAVIAAVVIGVLIRDKVTAPDMASQNNLAAHQLPAGTDKAILTTADGSQILLDSISDGVIDVQSGSRVIKRSGGLLSYESAERTGKAVTYNMLHTPRGGQYQVVLPDGSHVWLNAASSIRYPTLFTGPRREVELTGQAYFEVSANVHQPFVVKAAGISVKVLGTSFDIMAYENEAAVKATLVSGSVQLEASDGEELILTPGAQGIKNYSRSGLSIENPDLREVLAWKDGYFRFTNIKLDAIARQLERWYDIDVQYEKQLGLMEFGGIISRRANAQTLFEVLEATRQIKFITNGRKVTVVSY